MFWQSYWQERGRWSSIIGAANLPDRFRSACVLDRCLSPSPGSRRSSAYRMICCGSCRLQYVNYINFVTIFAFLTSTAFSNLLISIRHLTAVIPAAALPPWVEPTFSLLGSPLFPRLVGIWRLFPHSDSSDARGTRISYLPSRRGRPVCSLSGSWQRSLRNWGLVLSMTLPGRCSPLIFF